MTEYLRTMMERLDFPKEAEAALLTAQRRLDACPGCAAGIDALMDRFYEGQGGDADAILEALGGYAGEAGIHRYEMHMLFFLCCSKRLKDEYRQAGIAEDIYWNSMADLRWKLAECHTVYGVWGTFSGHWFPGFFTLRRFALGRMQYERARFNFDRYDRAGYTVRRDDAVYAMHIPSSGPLTREKRMDSYRKAYAFFREELAGRPLTVVCGSWLLYPENETFLPAGSNIVDFMHDFEILDSQPKDTFSDAWRIFGSHGLGPAEDWPGDTSMQRAFRQWVCSGRKTGTGVGVLLFDGERIL